MAQCSGGWGITSAHLHGGKAKSNVFKINRRMKALFIPKLRSSIAKTINSHTTTLST